MGKHVSRFTDYDGERSSATIPVANDTGPIELQAITDALVGITIGTLGEVNFTQVDQLKADDNTRPVSPFAQRETKWLVTYQDSITGDLGQFEIPTADLLVLGSGGEADPTNAAVIAFKAAVESELVTRAGNSATIVSIKHVGRNI